MVDCEFCKDDAPATVVASTPYHVYVMCKWHRDRYVEGQEVPFRQITAIQYPAMDYDGALAVAIGLNDHGLPLGPYLCESCLPAYLAGQAAADYTRSLWWIHDVRLAPREGGGYRLTGIRAEGNHFVDIDDARVWDKHRGALAPHVAAPARSAPMVSKRGDSPWMLKTLPTPIEFGAARE